MEGQVFGGRVGPAGITALPWEETAFVAPSSPVQPSFRRGVWDDFRNYLISAA